MAKKTISPKLKLKIAFKALKEERHIGDIAAEHGIHWYHHKAADRRADGQRR
jgi:hypothetical protein